MLSFNFITIHPQFLQNYADFGPLNQARQKNLATFNYIQLRDYAVDKHGSIDAKPFGGGDGMIMRPEPVRDALGSIPEKTFVIHFDPVAPALNRQHISTFAHEIQQQRMPTSITFICSRFGGIDQRIIDKYVHASFCVGDITISGAELPALMFTDALLREIPGVLGDKDSAANDSFAKGCDYLPEAPQYCKPVEFEGISVPDILLSGHHQKIQDWRYHQQQKRLRKDHQYYSKSKWPNS